MVVQLLTTKQDGERDGDGDGGSSTTGDPPPSYEATSTPQTSPSDMERKMSPMQDAFSRRAPARAPSIDPIAGSSSQSLPLLQPTSRTADEEQRDPFLPNPHGFSSSPDRLQQPSPPIRPRPNTMRASSDPRFRSMQAHIREQDQFGNSFHDESPFAVARRAQLGENGSGYESDHRVYANGRMPSFKPGDIVPVNTMRLGSANPPFILPHEAPSFPPMQHRAPIRPAHFPPEFHPTPPPPQQPTPVPSHQHPQQAHVPPPFRSTSVRQSQPVPLPQHHASSPPPARSLSNGRAPSAPLLPQSLLPGNGVQIPPHAANAPPSSRSLSPDPPGLMPNGHHAIPQTSHPQRHNIPQDHQGYPLLPPPGHPSTQPSGIVPHDPRPRLQPGPSILRPTQRHSDQPTPLNLQFVPAPVRLPSENVRPQSVQALGIVHAPPKPSSSPRPDPSRPPRNTPKPVMPQPLAPLSKQEANYGPVDPKQLQRSATVVPTQKGGFLSKTKSILRKRGSTSGIQTHADGAINFAPSSYPSKQEMRAPALAPVKEERAGGLTGKISKRLSRK